MTHFSNHNTTFGSYDIPTTHSNSYQLIHSTNYFIIYIYQIIQIDRMMKTKDFISREFHKPYIRLVFVSCFFPGFSTSYMLGESYLEQATTSLCHRSLFSRYFISWYKGTGKKTL